MSLRTSEQLAGINWQIIIITNLLAEKVTDHWKNEGFSKSNVKCELIKEWVGHVQECSTFSKQNSKQA